MIKGFAPKIPIEDRKLNLDDTQGMFLVLGSGVFISILSLFLEYIFYLISQNCCAKSEIEIIDIKNESELIDWPPNFLFDSVMSIGQKPSRRSI